MPIYEYACTKCRHEFELLVRNGEPIVCPDCGNPKLDRLLSAPAAHTGEGKSSLPVAEANCGRAQCQSGCQFS